MLKQGGESRIIQLASPDGAADPPCPRSSFGTPFGNLLEALKQRLDCFLDRKFLLDP
jgi:hypothetical protein